MGNGALSRPEGGELIRELQVEFDKYSGLGYGDEIIAAKLEARYTIFLTSKAQETKKPLVAAHASVATSDEKGAAASIPKVPAANTKAPAASGKGLGKGKPTPKKGGTRRRSFEPATAAASNIPLPNPNMAASASVPVLAKCEGEIAAEATPPVPDAAATAQTADSSSAPASTPGEKDDHWDSVSQMPYCKICKMAFKSEGILSRHVKYSELHKKSVEKVESDAAAAYLLPETIEDASKSQVEGKDYFLLYYGSKFFWRSQDNIDLSFYHHILCDCIEVIPYDASKNQQLDRLYLDMPLCKEMATAEGKSSSASKSSVADTEEATRKALTTAILARLHLHNKVLVSTGPKSESNRAIQYLPASSDNDAKSPLLDKMPGALIPRSVTHRRNTSSEEFQAKMHDLAKDQASLAHATSKAEKVVSVITNFAKGISNSSKQLAGLNKPRRRWVMAIRRVLQINGVAKTTIFLDELAKREAARSPGSKMQRAKALA
jgi:hypothetical protein